MEPREFDHPYELTHSDGEWWTLKANGLIVASYSLKTWGTAEKIIEAAWQHAYGQPNQALSILTRLAQNFETYADDCDECARRGMGSKTRNKHRAECWREAASDVRDIAAALDTQAAGWL